MRTLHFDNLGEIGIVEDVTDHELPYNAWTGGENIRFSNRAVEKMTGHTEVFGTPLGPPHFAIPLQKGPDYFWFYASLTDLFSTDGTNHYNVSVTTGSAQATADINWNGGALGGGVMILNNGIDEPMQWTGTALNQQFATLANWPAGMTARVVRPFKQVLVAGDVDDGSGRNGTLLRWSHPAVPGGVPASWDYLDERYDAGRKEIAQGGDFIVEMEPLRDVNMIYKENSAWTMQHVGGDEVYAFRKAFDQLGILSRRCAKEFFGQHIVLANEDIILHDGHQTQQVMAHRWKRWLFSNIDGTYNKRSFIVLNHYENEAWFCFPETGATFPNKALIWNWRDNTTYVRELPTGTAHIERGLVDTGGSNTIDDTDGTFGTILGTFDDQVYSTARRYLLFSDASRTKFYRGDTTEQFNGSNMIAYVERAGLPLGRPANDRTLRRLDLTTMKYVFEVWPVIEGTIGGVVNVYVGSRKTIGGAVSWSGPHPFVIGTTQRITVRKSGIIIDIKFESSTNIEWKLSSYAIKYDLGGPR